MMTATNIQLCVDLEFSMRFIVGRTPGNSISFPKYQLVKTIIIHMGAVHNKKCQVIHQLNIDNKL